MTSVSRQQLVSLSVFAALAILWEILAFVYTVEAQPGEPMVAGWGTLFTRTLLSLSDYWQGGFGVPAVADGAARSYPAALLSIISHSLATLARLASGLRLAAFSASRLAWPFPGRRGAADWFNSRRSFCALCRCSPWCRCSSFGSAPISLVRSYSSLTASA